MIYGLLKDCWRFVVKVWFVQVVWVNKYFGKIIFIVAGVEINSLNNSCNISKYDVRNVMLNMW